MIDFGRGDVFTKLKLVDGIMDVWRFLDVEEACIASWNIERNHISLEDSKLRVIYKVYLLVLDDEETNHNKDNPNYVIRKVEIDPEDWFKSKYDAYDKYDIEDDYRDDRYDDEFVIESTIKNLSTRETFINCEYELDAFISDDLSE